MSAANVNVLLLGESGVGKSTFINAFANYNRFRDFNVAVASNLVCLIPTKFTITDEDYNFKLVQLNEDGNENCDVGTSATQEPKEYLFEVGDQTICLIDTPGVGDSRGIEQDEKNIRNIMNYIQKFKHLNAICFLLKPNESILTEYFRFCIGQLFGCLPKTAAENIIFVFTNTRSTCYRPAETMPVLKSLLNEMSAASNGVNIPCNIKNVFCVDNEAFRYLVALKCGLTFTESEREDFSSSWKTSADCCRSMLQHIVANLEPHELQQAVSMHEAKGVIELLCPILLDIYTTKENIGRKLQLYEEVNTLKESNNVVTFLQQEVMFDKNYKKGPDDIMVVLCTKCRTGDKDRYYYKQICHMRCGCINTKKSLISSCTFDYKGDCVRCGCSSVYHEKVKRLVNIPSRSTNKQETTTVMRIRTHQTLLESEFNLAIKALAKLSHFVNENSMGRTAISFEIFMEEAIIREERFETERNLELLQDYHQLQQLHTCEKQILDEALSSAKAKEKNLSVVVVSNDDVIKCLEELRNMPITGAVLSQCTTAETVQSELANILHPPINKTRWEFQIITYNDFLILENELYGRVIEWKSLTPPCFDLIKGMSIVDLIALLKEYEVMVSEENNVRNISNDLIKLDSLLIQGKTMTPTTDNIKNLTKNKGKETKNTKQPESNSQNRNIPYKSPQSKNKFDNDVPEKIVESNINKRIPTGNEFNNEFDTNVHNPDINYKSYDTPKSISEYSPPEVNTVTSNAQESYDVKSSSEHEFSDEMNRYSKNQDLGACYDENKLRSEYSGAPAVRKLPMVYETGKDPIDKKIQAPPRPHSYINQNTTYNSNTCNVPVNTGHQWDSKCNPQSQQPVQDNRTYYNPNQPNISGQSTSSGGSMILCTKGSRKNKKNIHVNTNHPNSDVPKKSDVKDKLGSVWKSIKKPFS